MKCIIYKPSFGDITHAGYVYESGFGRGINKMNLYIQLIDRMKNHG